MHLQIKIHRSCPGELEDVVKQLEEATNSVAVGQIGRTLIIYRPSLSKMKAEEKKKQVRKLFLEKQRKLKLVYKVKKALHLLFLCSVFRSMPMFSLYSCEITE